MTAAFQLTGPTRTEKALADGNVLVTVTPPAWSGFNRGASVILTQDQYQRYRWWLSGCGDYLQNVLQDLSPNDREILRSGIHPEDFDDTFAE